MDEAGVKAAVARLSNDDAQRLRAAYGERFFDLEDDASAEPARRGALKQDAAFKDLKLAVKLGLLLQKRQEKEPALTLVGSGSVSGDARTTPLSQPRTSSRSSRR